MVRQLVKFLSNNFLVINCKMKVKARNINLSKQPNNTYIFMYINFWGWWYPHLKSYKPTQKPREKLQCKWISYLFMISTFQTVVKSNIAICRVETRLIIKLLNDRKIIKSKTIADHLFYCKKAYISMRREWTYKHYPSIETNCRVTVLIDYAIKLQEYTWEI